MISEQDYKYETVLIAVQLQYHGTDLNSYSKIILYRTNDVMVDLNRFVLVKSMGCYNPEPLEKHLAHKVFESL